MVRSGVNMSKIVIILLLSTGVFALLDHDGVENIKPDKVQIDDLEEAKTFSESDMPNEKPITDTNSEAVNPTPKAKKASVGLNKEQIDLLAEKVIRIHGVELGSDDEETQKNINNLRNVVANVEKNLNEKLKLTQTRKANANEKNEVTGSKQPAENTKENIETVKDANKETTDDGEVEDNGTNEKVETETNIDDVASVDQLSENDAEQEVTNDNAEQSTTETDISGKDETEGINNEEEINTNSESDDNEAPIDIEEDATESKTVTSDALVETGENEELIPEPEQQIYGETTKEDRAENAPVNAQTDSNTVTEEGRSEGQDIVSDAETLKDNENDKPIEENAEDTIDDIVAASDSEQVADSEYKESADAIEESTTDEIEQNNVNDDINEAGYTDPAEEKDSTKAKNIEEEESSDPEKPIEEDADVEDITEEDDAADSEQVAANAYDTAEDGTKEKTTLNEVQQDNVNDDINETSHVESADEDQTTNANNIEEDDVSSTCSLGDECDQAENRKLHAYSEEFNSEKTTEQELESEVEDTHLQRLIKLVTSIF